MRKDLIIGLLSPLLFGACHSSSDNIVSLTVSEEVINSSYIGNGVEWDPYDEAEAWGSKISDEDWDKLFSRLDYMRPAYVRCMINSPYHYYEYSTGNYVPEKHLESISRLLDYCQRRDIMVVYGEYNPPKWDLREDQGWIDMSVDYLNKLVNEKGFDCIKYFVIFNEPDGDWASPNGDFNLWAEMAGRFHKKMSEYPGLLDKVSLAGPDVVVDYKNPGSEYDTAGWIKATAANLDSIIGIYDIHAYPGQIQVRDGSYRALLQGYKDLVPEGKKIILGEAGYKYWREPDSLLMAEYNRRVEDHPFTKGTDCNMLVYDNFYGIDMPLLISEVMNAGFSGVAAWMLDDAMHSQGDAGKTEDIKIWGMWNILGKEVFGDASQEDVRPWYYTWSLMCRYFPKGCEVMKCSFGEGSDGLFAVSAKMPDGKKSVAIINVGNEVRKIELTAPQEFMNASLYQFTEKEGITLGEDGFPAPLKTGVSSPDLKLDSPANSIIVVTEME